MNKEQGNIEIHSENIFPIIKKWLYSDRDIFIRELISNASDAITKHRKLALLGETSPSEEDYAIHVVCDEKAGTLTFEDNGIGMTDDEVRRYINQVAFSSAEEFLSRYKGDEGGQIIGHFGLGFYSSFMVASKVTIDTKSWQQAESVRWECDGDTSYSMQAGTREKRGTLITLYLNDENKEFLNLYSVQEVLHKYCSFLPVPIFISKPEEVKEGEEKKDPAPINDIHPLWLKTPSECTDEEYIKFYHKVFTDYNEPLFWVHLNVDYPFRLTGILYFPKITHQFDSMEGRVKLYNNQVFVADNVSEVVPEYLMMLKGVIDCPDLPLNVSRSFLQSDKEVQKIPAYITRKVADKLTNMDTNDAESYRKYWPDIRPFVQYGCMRDDKFYDRMKDHLIYKQAGGDYITMQTYLDANKDKAENKVYYASHEQQQGLYIDMYRQQNLDVLVMDGTLDGPFINFLESKLGGVQFQRVDAELPESMKADGQVVSEDQAKRLSEAFQKASGQSAMKVRVERLASKDTPAMIQLSEYARRFQEMNMLRGMDASAGNLLDAQTELVLNADSPIVQALEDQLEQDATAAEPLCRQVYDLARLSSGRMTPEEMVQFVKRSQDLLLRQMNG